MTQASDPIPSLGSGEGKTIVDVSSTKVDASLEPITAILLTTDVPEKEVLEIKDSAHEEQDFPDGGMNAWGVVLASFMAQFIVWGSAYSFGVYNNYYISAG
ncbi:hypothetical protein HDU99_003330, partial [Rhizoclosmatium hyalinum]